MTAPQLAEAPADLDERRKDEGGPEPETPDMPENGDMEGETSDEQPAPEMVLEGEKKLNSRIGGPEPTLASATLKTKTFPIPAGQYDKHQEIDLLVRVRCVDISFPDKAEKGTLYTERKHDFKVVKVERVG